MKVNEETLLKFTTKDGTGPYSHFRWPINEWVDVEGPLEMCLNGIHACTPIQSFAWFDYNCHLVTMRGERLIDESNDKVCLRSARISPPLATWNERTQRLLAADFADRVLHLFEEKYPDDDRPREAIRDAREHANGTISHVARAASWAAAGASAWDTARDAAVVASGSVAWDAAGVASIAAATAASMDAERAVGDASREAAWAVEWAAGVAAGSVAWDAREAAWDAAWVAREAAWDAAGDAEREWQTGRLIQYLNGEVE